MHVCEDVCVCVSVCAHVYVCLHRIGTTVRKEEKSEEENNSHQVTFSVKEKKNWCRDWERRSY